MDFWWAYLEQVDLVSRWEERQAMARADSWTRQAHEGGELEKIDCPECFTSDRPGTCDYRETHDYGGAANNWGLTKKDDKGVPHCQAPDHNPLALTNQHCSNCLCEGSGLCHLCNGSSVLWYDPKMTRKRDDPRGPNV